jgi:RNA polymerase sigma-70 factor (ECF subfamily)
MAGNEPATKPPRSHAEERLLIEAAQRDPARFADLYEAHFHLVYAYVSRRIRPREAVEDLTSDVFHKALEHLPRFKWTGAPFGAWLLKIAANMIADRGRRASREQNISDLEKNIDEPTSFESAGVSLEEVEQSAQLFRMVQLLPEDQRRVIFLRFAEEKSIRDIAEQLGRSEGAVKQLQFRGLENLRAQIGSYAR